MTMPARVRAPAPERYRVALEAALGTPFFEDNRVDVLRNGVEIFPAMLQAIEEARESVDLLTYIYWSGEIATRFADRLSRAAARGVRVRVLLDGIGSIPIDRGLLARMEQAGVEVRWFRPVRRWLRPGKMTHRTHRKVLVCDHAVGFTGGVGIGEEWEGDARHPGEWRETHFRIEGPVITGLHAAFLGNWLEVVPDADPGPPAAPGLGQAGSEGRGSSRSRSRRAGPRPAGSLPIQVVRSSASAAWSDMATLLHSLVTIAEHSIRVSTPYFGPDQEITEHLVAAARRGVAVSILVPGPHIDHRVAQVAAEDWYETLLDAGVSICEYLPTMIHQKITVIDSQVVAIGSGNLNHRSLLQDDEVQLVVDDRGFAETIDEMLDDDWSRSERVRPAQWKRRGIVQRTAELLVRPFRHQM